MTVLRSYDVLCHVIPCYPYIWYHLVLTGRIGMDRIEVAALLMALAQDLALQRAGVQATRIHPVTSTKVWGIGMYWAFALGGPQSCKCM